MSVLRHVAEVRSQGVATCLLCHDTKDYKGVGIEYRGRRTNKAAAAPQNAKALPHGEASPSPFRIAPPLWLANLGVRERYSFGSGSMTEQPSIATHANIWKSRACRYTAFGEGFSVLSRTMICPGSTSCARAGRLRTVAGIVSECVFHSKIDGALGLAVTRHPTPGPRTAE